MNLRAHEKIYAASRIFSLSQPYMRLSHLCVGPTGSEYLDVLTESWSVNPIVLKIIFVCSLFAMIDKRSK